MAYVRKSRKAKLSLEDFLEVKRRIQLGRQNTPKAIAADFGVSKQTIWRITHGYVPERYQLVDLELQRSAR